MTPLVLPDSNFYIRSLRAREDPFETLSAHADEWDFATCGMVITEVCRGLREPRVLQRFRETFAVMILIGTHNAVWERTAQLAWALDRQGVILPAADLLIAAHALHTDATVLTYDAHFRAIPGLRVVQRLS